MPRVTYDSETRDAIVKAVVGARLISRIELGLLERGGSNSATLVFAAMFRKPVQFECDRDAAPRCIPLYQRGIPRMNAQIRMSSRRKFLRFAAGAGAAAL